ncbi:LysR family transcriptional regulator [Shewanella intestini]|uniref:LysR family transcriptional regulator n=1 Tax=Shewanella intestini TaxID=2017544 RepID=A0ABS5I3F2_9GAMM|nr:MULTISPECIES: LysR family transcriptional regulator [Shewanella]MBR9728558.1 LysR family transcriptional regulator [Shewanella intestini]MRG36377.1 LysR family transcriptional regulator [Shewanella sp. XMDDZSB0408]
MKHSDYSLIPTFVAIMEQKNYTRAAQKLGISQSAVSQGVSRLKEIFNDPLFIRCRHGVEPTQFALDIYPTLANAIENIAYTLPEYQKFDPAVCNKQFVISALSVFGFTLLPELAMRLSQVAPLASMNIDAISGQDPADMLRTQQSDILIEVKSQQSSLLRSKVIMQDKVCVTCRQDHPMLVGTSITQAQFLQQKHITIGSKNQKAGYLTGRGLKDDSLLQQRTIAWQASSTMEVLPIIQKTDYLGLIPQQLMDQYQHRYQLKQLQAPFLQERIDIAMFWHPSRNNDPSHQWLRSEIALAAKKYTSSRA